MDQKLLRKTISEIQDKQDAGVKEILIVIAGGITGFIISGLIMVLIILSL